MSRAPLATYSSRARSASAAPVERRWRANRYRRADHRVKARSEHLAWGDPGTVIWANSVAGARTNYEAGPAAVAAGLTGVTPAYGYHLDAQRAGSLAFEIRAQLEDFADWGALGGVVGRRTLDYRKVPVLTGVHGAPGGDELKRLASRSRRTARARCFTWSASRPRRATPPRRFAARRPGAAGHRRRRARRVLPDVPRRPRRDRRRHLLGAAALGARDPPARGAAGGRRVHGNIALRIATNFANREMASRLGYVGAIEDAGGRVLSGVCGTVERLAQAAS